MSAAWTRGIASMVTDDGAGHALLGDFDDVPSLGLLLARLRAVQREHRLPALHVRESSCRGGVRSYHALAYCVRPLAEIAAALQAMGADASHVKSMRVRGYAVLRDESREPDGVLRHVRTLSSPHVDECEHGDLPRLEFR